MADDVPTKGRPIGGLEVGDDYVDPPTPMT
jgi:hypothetical protein